MATWEVHIKGIVQGVGFRPFVYRFAQQLAWKGYVQNRGHYVAIQVNGSLEILQAQLEKMMQSLPVKAAVHSINIHPAEEHFFNAFKIIDSDTAEEPSMVVTPDLAICHHCIDEVNDQKNRRYGYAYTTCTDCGPRYSINNKTPYDRANTEMTSYSMCDACYQEYTDSNNRRFHSQTNSCPDCGIRHQFLDRNQNIISVDQEDGLSQVISAWQSDNTVAIKGIGGYLLTAACTDGAIAKVRKQKNRPSKPLAIMLPSVDSLKDDTPEYILSALQSAAAPIVLVDSKWLNLDCLPEALTYGLDRVGVMLPYTALYALLLQKYSKPIIATSANPSSHPIIYRDEDIAKIDADYYLTNDRAITTPQDDSLMSFTQDGQRIIHRRGRGLSPNTHIKLPEYSVAHIGIGADLKSAIAIQSEGLVASSTYVGNLSSYDTQLQLEQVSKHLQDLSGVTPKTVISDMHPMYISTRLAYEWSEKDTLNLVQVQHHEAHFAAVLAESNLLENQNTILGCVWDGTGYGKDGNIWGGEFFAFQNGRFERFAHLDYFPCLASDKMALEPRISAMSLLMYADIDIEILKSKFSRIAFNITEKQLAKSQLKTSSMGRLFDGVSSLLDLCDKQDYEGEAAMRLEQVARHYVNMNDIPKPYKLSLNNGVVDFANMIESIVHDITTGKDSGWIAAKFHMSCVDMIRQVADTHGINKIAFSGGVFQNSLIVEMTTREVSDKTKYWHQELSPNDENIAVGQIAHHYISTLKNQKPNILEKEKIATICV